MTTDDTTTKQDVNKRIAANLRYFLAMRDTDRRRNSKPLREALGISVQRARDLYNGRTDFRVDEVVRLAAWLRVPWRALWESTDVYFDELRRTNELRETHRKQLESDPTTPSDTTMEVFERSLTEGRDSLATLVWRLADDPEFLKIALFEAVQAIPDFGIDDEWRTRLRWTLEELGHRLRIHFPGRDRGLE